MMGGALLTGKVGESSGDATVIIKHSAYSVCVFWGGVFTSLYDSLTVGLL